MDASKKPNHPSRPRPRVPNQASNGPEPDYPRPCPHVCLFSTSPVGLFVFFLLSPFSQHFFSSPAPRHRFLLSPASLIDPRRAASPPPIPQLSILAAPIAGQCVPIIPSLSIASDLRGFPALARPRRDYSWSHSSWIVNRKVSAGRLGFYPCLDSVPESAAVAGAGWRMPA